MHGRAQVCTGKGLTSKENVDDCETNSQVHFAAQKAIDVSKASMIRCGFLQPAPCTDQQQQNALDGVPVEVGAPAIPAISPHQDTPTLAGVSKEVSDMVEMHVPKSVFSSMTSQDRASLVAAIRNIHAQFSFELYPVAGTASAASVSSTGVPENAGEEGSVGGHMYSCLEATHIPTKSKFRYILEGTSWVSQTTGADRLTKLSKEDFNAINECSTLLMELTKIPSVAPGEDMGSIRSIMQEDAQKSFYVNVYVSGNKINMLKVPCATENTAGGVGGTDSPTLRASEESTIPPPAQMQAEPGFKYVLGVPAHIFVDISKDHMVRRVPVTYSLVQTQMQSTFNKSVLSSSVTDIVSKIGMAGAIPAWPR